MGHGIKVDREVPCNVIISLWGFGSRTPQGDKSVDIRVSYVKWHNICTKPLLILYTLSLDCL